MLRLSARNLRLEAESYDIIRLFWFLVLGSCPRAHWVCCMIGKYASWARENCAFSIEKKPIRHASVAKHSAERNTAQTATIGLSPQPVVDRVDSAFKPCNTWYHAVRTRHTTRHLGGKVSKHAESEAISSKRFKHAGFYSVIATSRGNSALYRACLLYTSPSPRD